MTSPSQLQLRLRQPPLHSRLKQPPLHRHFKAATAAVGLSVLFLVVYGGCNWITGRRPHVGSGVYFEWERGIPFVPFMILPYMSIDVFFVLAPFLCRSDEELRTFSRRVAAAIVIAGLCFLIFPLRFAFARPEATGWLGALFDWFRGMDAPFNLAPSLHAALLLLVGNVYARNLRGVARWMVMSWFVLIGFSPLFTYQHHLIDLITGFALAWYCFYVFPQRRFALPVRPNRRIGLYYATGAMALVVVAFLLKPWGLILLWAASALAIVGTAYFGVGPGVFRKSNGHLPWSTRFVLGPCLSGQFISLLYYRRKSSPWDRIVKNVWIGGRLRARDADEALRAGVTSVLDLTAEFSESKALSEIGYCYIPVLDLTAPTHGQLKQMADFISDRSRTGVVYVHCKIGYSRSAAAVAAYLLMSGAAKTAGEAFDLIRRARPSIVIRPEIVAALEKFEREQRRPLVSEESFVLASERETLA